MSVAQADAVLAKYGYAENAVVVTYGDSSQMLIEQRDILTAAEQLTEKDL